MGSRAHSGTDLCQFYTSVLLVSVKPSLQQAVLSCGVAACVEFQLCASAPGPGRLQEEPAAQGWE